MCFCIGFLTHKYSFSIKLGSSKRNAFGKAVSMAPPFSSFSLSYFTCSPESVQKLNYMLTIQLENTTKFYIFHRFSILYYSSVHLTQLSQTHLHSTTLLSVKTMVSNYHSFYSLIYYNSTMTFTHLQGQYIWVLPYVMLFRFSLDLNTSGLIYKHCACTKPLTILYTICHVHNGVL